MLEKTTIGLDLGTGNCCVASVRNGIVSVLPNAHGKKTTPSFVAFSDTRCLVGSSAKDQATVNPTNTIYGIKTILGRDFNDPVLKNYSRFSSCSIVENEGKPVVEVNYRDSTLRPSPELIAAMQILDMKQQAEREVGEVEGAVVSVPAYYGNSQREAIVAACQIASLELLDLISEPTATALSYRENRASSSDQTILVFDMGAAKLDVSVIRVSQEDVRVLAVCGDDNFGGDNLDQCLMELVEDKFFATHDQRLSANPRSKMKLKMVCENLKKNLTLLPSSKILEDSILGDLSLDVVVTRNDFEALFSSKFSDKLTSVLKFALTNAKLSADQIDEVVVVGGCSRVPYVQECLKKFFSGKSLNKTVNADECVASGAALLAKDLIRSISARDFRIKEMIQDPTPRRSDFYNYMELNPSLMFEYEFTNSFNDGTEERMKYTFTLGPFGVFKIDTLYMKPFDKNQSLHPKDSQHSVVSSMTDQLKTLEKHRKNIEAAEAASNDLEEYCYGLQKLEFSQCDLEVRKYIKELLEWADGQEKHSVSECEERKNKLSQMWEDMKHQFEDFKATRSSAYDDDVNDAPELTGERAARKGDLSEVQQLDQTSMSFEGSRDPLADEKEVIEPQRTLEEASGYSRTTMITDFSCKSGEASEFLLEIQAQLQSQSRLLNYLESAFGDQSRTETLAKSLERIEKNISEMKELLHTVAMAVIENNNKPKVIEETMLTNKVEAFTQTDNTTPDTDPDFVTSNSLTSSMISADSAFEELSCHDVPASPSSQILHHDGRRRRDDELSSAGPSAVSKNRGADKANQKNFSPNKEKKVSSSSLYGGDRSRPSSCTQVSPLYSKKSSGSPVSKSGSGKSSGHDEDSVTCASGTAKRPANDAVPSKGSPLENKVALVPQGPGFTPVRNCLRSVLAWVFKLLQIMRLFPWGGGGAVADPENQRGATGENRVEQRSKGRQRDANANGKRVEQRRKGRQHRNTSTSNRARKGSPLADKEFSDDGSDVEETKDTSNNFGNWSCYIL